MFKKALIVGIALFGLITVSAVGQMIETFKSWPVLYEAMEEGVVKAGTDLDGNPNGFLYFRVGWGDCLAVRVREIKQFYKNAPSNRYMNVRDYADARYETEGWNREHQRNCPPQPLGVAPSLTGSRVTFEYVYNEDLGLWQRGQQTQYLVSTDDPFANQCYPEWPVYRSDGSTGMGYMLSLDATVFDENGSYSAYDLNVRLAVLCEPLDVDIEDWVASGST